MVQYPPPGSHLHHPVQEEQQTGGVAVLLGGDHEVHVVVLNEQERHALVVDHRLAGGRVVLCNEGERGGEGKEGGETVEVSKE